MMLCTLPAGVAAAAFCFGWRWFALAALHTTRTPTPHCTTRLPHFAHAHTTTAHCRTPHALPHTHRLPPPRTAAAHAAHRLLQLAAAAACRAATCLPACCRTHLRARTHVSFLSSLGQCHLIYKYDGVYRRASSPVG